MDPFICVSYTSKLWESHWSADAISWDFTSLFFYLQACFLHWTYWNLLGAVAFPACSAPQRRWKITLSSLCFQGIRAAALLSQNWALCCSDSTSLGLISPGVPLHVLTHIKQVTEGTFVRLIHFSSPRWPMCRMSFPFSLQFFLGFVVRDKIMVFNRFWLKYPRPQKKKKKKNHLSSPQDADALFSFTWETLCSPGNLSYSPFSWIHHFFVVFAAFRYTSIIQGRLSGHSRDKIIWDVIKWLHQARR